MASHPGHMIRVQEPNGSWTERPMHEALAELGARVLIALNIKTPEERDAYVDAESAQAALQAIIFQADALGLLDTIGPRPDDDLPADRARGEWSDVPGAAEHAPDGVTASGFWVDADGNPHGEEPDIPSDRARDQRATGADPESARRARGEDEEQGTYRAFN